MVITTLEPISTAYKLYSPFRMPSEGGSTWGIAISAERASQVGSLYALMISVFVWQTWTLCSFMVIYTLVIRNSRKSHSHNAFQLSAAIFNGGDFVRAAFHVFGIWWSRKVTKPAVFSLIGILLGISANVAVPTFVTPYLFIGQGAPVNESSVYVPNMLQSSASVAEQIRWTSLNFPAAQRSVGAALLVNETVRDQVHISSTIHSLPEGQPIVQVDYSYEIFARDFGLQHYPSLRLEVSGSCQSSYSYLINSTEVNGHPEDYYNIPDVGFTRSVSRSDGAPPLAYFQAATPIESDDSFNTTYAMIPSTLGRKSFSEGMDPLYYTGPNHDSNNIYTVQPRRPVLLCWQRDAWIYKNRSYSVSELANTDISSNLHAILWNYFHSPRITLLTSFLGSLTLESATTSIGPYFNAQTSSTVNDLTRLVLTSYISSTNILTDTIMHLQDGGVNTISFPNAIQTDNPDDLAWFVIYSSNVRTLSVIMLIAVPLVTLVWFGLVWGLCNLSCFPWFKVNGLQATVLLRCLDEEMGDAPAPRGNITDEDKQTHPGGNEICIIPKKDTHKEESVCWEKSNLT